jgi:hypothetical protein
MTGMLAGAAVGLALAGVQLARPPAPRVTMANLTSAASFPTVTADAFDPAQIGAPAPPRRTLRNLLVTGDSMSKPLNSELYKLLASHGVHVYSDLHYGGGISKDFVFDWPDEAATITRKLRPDATVVFIGANEGFPLRGPHGRRVRCCGANWAAAYANRGRQMLAAYRRGGAARVYWITVPALRDVRRTAIGRVINVAVDVAAEPWRRQVRLIDGGAIFTPDGYRDAMPVDGVMTVVREPDGMHLNVAGAQVLAVAVDGELTNDFALPDGGAAAPGAGRN